ncbi:hypothetical protein ACEPPN_015316 [Leptodophora sp. 'Broadleaf-Isolate-01']
MQRSSSGRGGNQRSHCREHDADAEPPTVNIVIPRTPSSKAIAPYTCRSDAEDASLQLLINHYVTFITQKTVTSPGPRREWFPFAVRESAFFHAMMAGTASHLAYMRNESGDNAEYFYHRGAAISLVNRGIASGKAATEGIIATVAAFTQQESLAAQVKSVRLHLNGMVQLIGLAGGLMSPILRPKTRRRVLQSDLSAAIVLMQPPRLQPTLLDPDVSAYFGPPSYCTIRHARTLGTCLTNFTASQELSEVAVNIYWGLRNISASLEAIQAGTEVADAVEECVQFSDRVEVLERATHTFWYCDAEDSTSSIFRLFGWASLIHIYTVLRELPAELRIMKLVATRIKAEMEKCLNLNVLLATFKDLMLWIIFLGGRVSDVSYKPFFAQQAAKILLVINITEDQADILQASQRFLWPERSVLKC